MLSILAVGVRDMAEPVKQAESSEWLADALCMMRNALHLLDQAGAPSDIGGHLDLAIVRLGKIVEPDGSSG